MASITDVKPADIATLADLNGVAIASVRDGYVVAFTRDRLESFIRQMDASGERRVLIFVKTKQDPQQAGN